jgi:hypothetical protein
MAVVCRRCAKSNNISTPPVRTRVAPCDICGSQSEDPKGRNFDYPDVLMPGNPNHPDKVAEREQNAT